MKRVMEYLVVPNANLVDFVLMIMTAQRALGVFQEIVSVDTKVGGDRPKIIQARSQAQLSLISMEMAPWKSSIMMSVSLEFTMVQAV